MGDTPERWRAFQKRWPDLFPPEFYADSQAEIGANVERAKRPVDAPFAEVFELRKSGVETRYLKPGADGRLVDYRQPEILRLRDLVRAACRGGPSADRSMNELLCLQLPVGVSPDVWSPPISADWQRGRIVVLPRTELQAACYALLQKSSLAKFCANPDCPAPYFIAKRATQRYCSPDCLKPFQKQAKLDWWNREGKLRRAGGSRKSQKGRRSHGARKAR